MTLIELLIATSIMAIMAGVLGGLAYTVQMHSRHSLGHGEAVQHARVILDRLQRTMNEAHANESFPGFVAFADVVGADDFPDTLVIWNPDGGITDPSGLPRWNEVVVFCPDPDDPACLLEIRCPTDSRTVPDLADTGAWDAELDDLKASNAVERVELTNLLRVAKAGTDERGVVRFDTLLRPSEQQWTEYENSTRDWDELDWVQGIYGSRTGLRQSWCRIELQLIPGMESEIDGTSEQSALTFFGSAAVYYEMYKS